MITERLELPERSERFNSFNIDYFATNIFTQEPYKSIFNVSQFNEVKA